MNRREASKIETRKLILKAARKLFQSKGVEGCTMRAVAKEAGVSAATVVLHFKSKIALLDASITKDIEGALTKALACVPQRAGLLTRLMHIPEAMYSFYDSDRNLYRALVSSTIFEPEEDNPEIKNQLDGYFLYLARIIEEEKQAGNVRRDVDAAEAAACMGALYIGVLIRFFRSPELTAEAATGMLETMKSQYLSGILTERR